MKSLIEQLCDAREGSKLSQSEVAKRGGLEPPRIADLENGIGGLRDLRAVARALGLAVRPVPQSLANKRRWRGIDEKTLAAFADIDLATLRALEQKGRATIDVYERSCIALEEIPRLKKREKTWSTPSTLIKPILEALDRDHFDLDPASPRRPTVPCSRHYTVKDGGLWLPWCGTVFVNPPYDDVPRWVEKAILKFERGRADKIVAVIPFRPETKAWKTVVGSEAVIFTLDDRLKFGKRSYISRSASAIIAWGLSYAEIRALECRLPSNRRYAERREPSPWW